MDERMRELRKRMLERFYRDAGRLSRNRNFHAYLDPNVARTARAGRLLRSLKQDLLHPDLTGMEISRVGEKNGYGGQILIDLWWEGARRTSYLTEVEFAVLKEDEHLGQLLAFVGEPQTQS